jgi:hypothetical protein
MAGITADISTSSFKPLSLDEIMMVPLAKQKMEDDFLAKSDKFSELEASTSSVDQEKASRILGEFKGRASGLSDNIINKGVSRSEFNKLRSLKSEVQNEYGSEGFLGNAIANKKAMGTFINDLATKKERQGGYSPAEAKQWAQMEAAKFNEGVGTQNEDGTFNSFSGVEMSTKVNEAEWIRKNIEDVAEQVSPSAMYALQVGGLNAFQKAFINEDVSVKDYNTIMRHLATQAGTDVDLQRSLIQTAALTGEEDVFDHGKFEPETYTKADGTEATRNVWKVGKSRFGAKMSGAGDAADYLRTNRSTQIIKDDVGFAMWESGMDQQAALDVLSFTNGEMMQDKVKSLSVIREDIEVYGDESSKYLGYAQKRKQQLLDSGMSLEDVKKDREFKRLDKKYVDSNTSYHNSKARLNKMYKKTDAKMSSLDKKLKKGYDILDEFDGDALKAMEELFPGELEKSLKQNKLGWRVGKERRAQQLLFAKGGVKLGDGPHSFSNTRIKYQERRDDIFEEYLISDPTASSFTILNGESTGKFATRIGRYNALVQEKFTSGSAVLANSLGRMEDMIEESDLGNLEDGSDYQYRVEGTDGFDDNGDHFNNVIVRNPDSGKSISVQVVDNLNDSELMTQAQLLKTGNYAQNKMGTELEAKINYIKQIKKGGLDSQKEGIIPIANLFDDNDERVSTTYKVEEGLDGVKHYDVFIGGQHINEGQPLYGETEVAVALQNFINQVKEDSKEEEKAAAKAKAKEDSKKNEKKDSE